MAEASKPRTYGRGSGRLTHPLTFVRAVGMTVETGRFTASDLILAALEYMDQHGWCQMGYVSTDGEVCGHGALMGAKMQQYAEIPPVPVSFMQSRTMFVDNPDRKYLEQVAVWAHEYMIEAAEKAGWKSEGCTHAEGTREMLDAAAILGTIPPHVCTPYKDPFAVFNDDPGTTVEDVKLMMKEAAELARGEGR